MVIRIFGINAALDGVTALLDVCLLVRQRLAGRNANLPRRQIDPRHQFSDGMLDLQACVHL